MLQIKTAPKRFEKFELHYLSYCRLESWWRHQMGTFSALLALCAGRPWIPRTHKGQWRGALIFSLICAWINDWVNNRETEDLRRHRAHYDVILIFRRNDCVVPRTVIPKVPLQCCALDGQNEGDAMDSYTSKGMTLRWKSIEPTTYRKTSNISGTLVGNKIVDHSDVVGASPVGAAPTSSSFST